VRKSEMRRWVARSMITLGIGLVLCLSGYGHASADEGSSSCIACHGELDDELAQPVVDLAMSTHGQAGLSCHDCHGGDPTVGHDGDAEEAMNPQRGYIGVPDRSEIPNLCGRCHSDEAYMRRFNPRIATDQEKAFWVSRHGERLQQGDPKVAQCVSCHDAHLVRSVADARSPVYPMNVPGTCGRCHGDPAYMEGYAIGSSQQAEYRLSVHGRALLDEGDLGAPACNDCHGNHGAVPPGVASVANVCGLCHPSPRDLFAKSPHGEIFEELGYAECSTCHGHHAVERPTDDLLGTGEGAICVECHTEGDEGHRVATVMKSSISALAARHARVEETVERAENTGLELAEIHLVLQEVHDQLIRSRNLVHLFDLAPVASTVAVGDSIAGVAEAKAQDALGEIRNRRLGLALSSVLIIILIIGLTLKVRRLDNP